LLKFDPKALVGLFQLSRLRTYLSEILGCDVDLVREDALHPMLKDKIIEETVRPA
jgi:predicted nucleotidyltransferase